ncbi:MAG: hypothetical protein ACKOGI_05445 [Vulcanococcus sp.]
MAFPTSHRPAATPACQSVGTGAPNRAYAEGGHQLEKLEFALAVAITRGDAQRIDQLRAQIAELGGNREEPGT